VVLFDDAAWLSSIPPALTGVVLALVEIMVTASHLSVSQSGRCTVEVLGPRHDCNERMASKMVYIHHRGTDHVYI